VESVSPIVSDRRGRCAPLRAHPRSPATATAQRRAGRRAS
jgi:hypothetical protein